MNKNLSINEIMLVCKILVHKVYFTSTSVDVSFFVRLSCFFSYVQMSSLNPLPPLYLELRPSSLQTSLHPGDASIEVQRSFPHSPGLIALNSDRLWPTEPCVDDRLPNTERHRIRSGYKQSDTVDEMSSRRPRSLALSDVTAPCPMACPVTAPHVQ